MSTMAAFVVGGGVWGVRRSVRPAVSLKPRRVPSRPVSMAQDAPPETAAVEAPSEQSTGTVKPPASVTLVGDSPFTEHINASPMAATDRVYYMSMITDCVSAAVDAVRSGDAPSNLIDVNAQLPDLNPACDIYDRRFVLSIVWDIIAELIFNKDMTVKVMTQRPLQFGGLPLSVAGLRTSFMGDLRVSAESWGSDIERVRTGDICAEDVEDDDAVFLLMLPTNVVSAPVVENIMKLADAVGPRPIICLNSRLEDVPSHSGVMQVRGRSGRQDFLKRFWNAFYLHLVYNDGTWYPVRGVLLHCYPGNWQVWSKRDTAKDDYEEYELLGEFPEKPTRSELDLAFQTVRGTAGNVVPTEVSVGLLIAIAVVSSLFALGPKALPHP